MLRGALKEGLPAHPWRPFLRYKLTQSFNQHPNAAKLRLDTLNNSATAEGTPSPLFGQSRCRASVHPISAWNDGSAARAPLRRSPPGAPDVNDTFRFRRQGWDAGRGAVDLCAIFRPDAEALDRWHGSCRGPDRRLPSRSGAGCMQYTPVSVQGQGTEATTSMVRAGSYALPTSRSYRRSLQRLARCRAGSRREPASPKRSFDHRKQHQYAHTNTKRDVLDRATPGG